MLDLQKMRNDIDEIDTRIVKLFEERMKICENVAQFKIETGKPVFDKSREQEKLDSLGGKAHNDFNRCGVQELFQQIMSISRKRQYQLLQENGMEEKSDFVKIDGLKKQNATVVFQGVNYLNDITKRLREFRYSVLLTDEQPFHLVYSLQLMNHPQTRYLAEYLQAEW